ncbi:MAG: Gfo/Idh/MocA family oxidoreductase [Planctomycetota bacterium]|nr:MAG: Gfo/Idh/MocA family oxidoreductase [Planctomycetota bacterium]
MNQARITRREVLKQAAAGLAAGWWLAGCQTARSPRSSNERLNLGIIGVANRGADNLAGVAGENIVALCDVDESYLGAAGARFPRAARYTDLRRMLDRNDLDAVVISTPDHTHAFAALCALEAGLDVYCEKPLTHTLAEARRVAELARRKRAVTQMGTQIHAGSNYRRVVELVQSGAIGSVSAAHCWVGRSWSGGALPGEYPPVPAGLHWDEWLGPAAERPYHPCYAPGNWRGWWNFGSGTLGDMGCHHLDLPFWALGLRHPTAVEASGPARDTESAPPWLQARWQFPGVALHWHDGGRRPPQFEHGLLPEWGDGTLFVGDKGFLLADYDRHVLLPEADFAGFVPPPPAIPESIGHYQEWIEACKTRGRTTCDFGYAGMLTETVLLGTIAYRAGEPLDWDARRMRVRNSARAQALVAAPWRRGWEV